MVLSFGSLVVWCVAVLPGRGGASRSATSLVPLQSIFDFYLALSLVFCVRLWTLTVLVQH